MEDTTLPEVAMTGVGSNGYAADAKSICREKNKLTQRQRRARLRQINLKLATKKQSPKKSGRQRMQAYRLRKKQSNQIDSYREQNKAQQARSRAKKMMVN
jgi:hypothetical protein